MLTLMETYINRPQPGKRRALQVLRDAEANPTGVDWVAKVLPGLCDDPVVAKAPTSTTPHDHIIKHWFGYKPHGKTWRPGTDPTTGYWVNYKGDVNAIVRGALRWALEVSLDLMPGEDRPGRPDPAPIEFLWMCNTNWFEAWVIQRPAGHGERLVSVVFATPGHIGAEVATSPVATSAKTMPPGAGHAVPSTQSDYELVGAPAGPPTARPRAVDRPYATWVVTHYDNRKSPQLTNNATGSSVGSGQFATLAAYTGTGRTVIVSPSVPAGGVPYDHWIRP